MTEESRSDGEEQLHEIIADYLAAAQAGQRPNRQALLTKHPELASELEAFFADHDRLQRWAEPARVSSRPRMGAPSSGDRVRYLGDYELLGEIAAGGMGVIYRARQRSLNRVVALKLIRTGDTASAEDIQRFRVEAEIFANLDHPNIVPIYEVGEHQGQQYFSMKLIDGGSLTEHLPRLLEDPRAAAQIVETVARAVDYAHERGILHRDLKPANILLDAKGQPLVSDFGLAKRMHGGACITQSGTILGSPAYMSPEQASGQVKELTTTADVYSLGAILYELLTSRPPFRADTPFDTLRQVTEREPKRPRTFNPQVSRDLETICMKCLEKDPKERYPSAGALADDLKRWLANESIWARRASMPERLWRRCCRYPSVPIFTCGVVALAFVLLLAMGWLVIRAQVATRGALAEEAMQRALAEANLQKARTAMDDLLTREADNVVDDRLRGGHEREFLEEALMHYYTLRESLLVEPGRRPDLAEAALRVGQIHQKLGQLDKAEKSYDEARILLEDLVKASPDKPEFHWGLARAQLLIGSVAKERGKTAEAEKAYRQALALAEKLVTDHPAKREYRNQLAFATAQLAALSIAKGRIAEAEAALHKALAVQEKLVQEAPNEPFYRANLASSLRELGRLLQTSKKLDQAEPAFRRALAIEEKLVQETPGSPDAKKELALTLTDYGQLLAQSGRFADAEHSFEKAAALLQKLTSDFPKVAAYQTALKTVNKNLNALSKQQGK
jgi:eukaryotic-like serine/threonine-protein kinase